MKAFLNILLIAIVVVALYIGFHNIIGVNFRDWTPLLGIIITNPVAGIFFNIILLGCVIWIIYSLLKKIFKRK